MIKLQISVEDATRSVRLIALTDQSSVVFYRRIGLTEEQILSDAIAAADGVATFVDVLPPEKTLLTYAAVNDLNEKSQTASGVVPSSWSLTRPALAGDIRMGDLILNTIDELGTVWTVSDIEGWWTLPDSQVPTNERAREEDGSYDENGRYLSRNLTLTGLFLPRAPKFLETSRARLVDSLNAVRRTTALRVDEDPPRQMQVRMSGKADISTIRQSGLTQFQVQLRAADPIKYSVVPMYQPAGDQLPVAAIGAGTPSGGRTYPRGYDIATDNLREYGTPGTPNEVQMVNLGNYPSPPLIRISGPVTNPAIVIAETGENMQFVTTLREGEYLDVDVKEKTVLLNGAISRRGTMTFSSEWLVLRPGVNTLRYTALSAPGNTTTVTVTAYSAWLG